MSDAVVLVVLAVMAAVPALALAALGFAFAQDFASIARIAAGSRSRLAGARARPKGWWNRRRCAACREVLSEHQVYYSNGRCPLCGHKGPHACTIVDTTEHAARYRDDGTVEERPEAPR